MFDFYQALRQSFFDSEAEPKHRLMQRVLEVGAAFGEPTHVFWVPGRIEVLGKHTDYGGGRSLLAATSRGFFFAVYPRSDNEVDVVDAQSNERFESRIAPDIVPEVGHWSNYGETVFRRVAQNFSGNLRGANIVFGSDLPQAAGMSSSSAMIVGFFLVMEAVNDLRNREEFRANIQTMEDLSGYLGTNENGQTFGTLVGDQGVGTFGGSEDHTAILNCRGGHLSQYRYCPVQFEREIVLPDDYVFAIGSSGVIAQKTGAAMAKYNRASRLASDALAVWNKDSESEDKTLAGAIERVGREPISICLSRATHDEFGADVLANRFAHFYAENEEILPGAGDALAAGDLALFGSWVKTSQETGVALLQNQVPETEFLAKVATEKGAVAASAFGAGFGGSVWSLVARAGAEEFIQTWSTVYHAAFPGRTAKSDFFYVEAGPGAIELRKPENGFVN